MGFEFNGEKYQEASAHQKKWGEQLVTELQLNGNEHILDLGCGSGEMTAQLAARLPDGLIVGIDSSGSMIETAARTYKSKNLHLEVRDINAIDYHDDFDIVISNAALHWIKDHDTLFKNVYRALKNNGILRFNFAAHGNCAHFISVIKQAIQAPEFSKYFHGFNWPWYMPQIDEYRISERLHPFSDIRIWGENADLNFPDADAMIRWIEQPSIVPFLKCIPEMHKPGFQNLVIKEMLEGTAQPNGTFFETFRRINIAAKKS